MLQQVFELARNGMRSAVRARRTTVLLIWVLALGIGASVAMFSSSYRALAGRVPYPQPGQVVLLQEIATDGTRLPMAFGTFLELETRARSFAAIAVARPWEASVRTGDGPERLIGRRVSAEYFDVLATRPALGAGFAASDDVPGGRRTVLISDALWQRRFERDPAVVGQPLQVDGVPYEIAGVLPHGFVDVMAPQSELWTLLQYDPSLPQDGREWGRHLQSVARMRDGTTRELAEREIADLAAHPVAEFARPRHADLRYGARVLDLGWELGRDVSAGLFAGLAAAIALLLVACANATNILLIRAQQRAGEIGLRFALGASRPRLVLQLVSENLVVTAFAATLGVLLADFGVRALAGLAPAGTGIATGLATDPAAALAALGLALAVGLLTGLLPALRATTPSPARGIELGSHRTVSRDDSGRRMLATFAIAMAAFVLVGAGLLYRTVARLGDVDPGFDAQRLLSLQVHAGSVDEREPASARAFVERAHAALGEVPGVESAALVQQLPLSGDDESYGVQFDLRAGETEPLSTSAATYVVSPGYFETMRIAILAGRGIERDDREDTAPSAVVSESIARRWFAGSSPIGRTVRIGGDPNGPTYTVVGVARDVRHRSLDVPAPDSVYVSHAHWPGTVGAHSVVLRTREGTARIADAAIAAIRAADANRPVSRVVDVAALVESGSAQRRFAARLFALFGAIALMLATTGLYGVLTMSVAERQREIGLRIALGAPTASLARAVLARGMLAACVGVATGLVAARAARPLMQGLLFDPAADFVLVSVVVAGLLLAAAGLASIAPLARASRVDPATVLRGD